MAENTSMQTGGAAAFQTALLGGAKVKEEYNDSFTDQHDHTFVIMFSGDQREHTFNCTEPQTVLKAIKSRKKYSQLGWSDDKIVIQWGRGDNEDIIATHFPCTCLKKADILIVSKTSESVEESQAVRPILPKSEYSVFYIDKEGGKHTKQKPLFKNNEVKQFKYLCVYGEKDTTVQDALERDGRFAQLPNFTLIDNSDRNKVTQFDDTIGVLNGKKCKIELPRGMWPRDYKKPKDPRSPCAKKPRKAGAASATEQQTGVRERTPGPSGDDTQTGDLEQMRDLVQRSGFKAEQFRLNDIMKQLRDQFPALKKLMESRFPGNSFQEALKLKKENFGKIQQDFSEVHTLRKLLEMGESVCHVVVDSVFAGTGFVLIDNFIMTNAHLFEKCTEGNTLREGTNVYVIFNYENPPPNAHYLSFKVEKSYISFIDDELDYAILKVQPEGQTWGPSAPAEQPKVPPGVPPGLLEYFWEMPVDGGACIIGHPGGKLKQIDLTCIIEPEKREQAAEDHLNLYRNSLFVLYSLVDHIKSQGIEKIMMGGSKEKKGFTYNTFMYHGASGSPVFDALGRVCGLHTSGYVYELENTIESVIEFAYSLEIIMKHLVETLTKGNDQELLGRIKEVSGRNSFLRKILESVSGGESNNAQQPDSGEPIETSQDGETGVRTNQ